MRNKIIYLMLFFAFLGEGVATAQDNGSVYGNDSIACIQNLSLYREYYKQENFEEAYRPWLWVMNNCPKVRKGMYIDGVAMMENKIKKETDAAKKNALVDSLLWVYDRRIANFGEEGFVTGRKALDMVEYQPEKVEEAFALFSKAIQLEGNESEPSVIFRYFQAGTRLYNLKKKTKVEVIELFEQLSSLVEANMKNGNNVERYDIARQNLETLFGPFASCEDLVNIYSSKVKANPTDTLLMKKVISLLKKKNCTDSPLFDIAVENLHKVEPSAMSAAGLAETYLKKGQSGKAQSYLQEAIDLEKDNNQKADYLMSLAQVQAQGKNYSTARANAQRAIALRPGWGRPYMLIGDMYANSAGTCSEFLNGKAVYWAAIDKYQQARSVDGSYADEAAKKIAAYSAYMPDQETVFFNTLNAGDSYKVGCWINESTTVRIK